jgi:hypothetical protein
MSSVRDFLSINSWAFEVISGTSRSAEAHFSACSGPSRIAPAGMFEPTPPSTQLYSPWPASYFGDLKK